MDSNQFGNQSNIPPVKQPNPQPSPQPAPQTDTPPPPPPQPQPQAPIAPPPNNPPQDAEPEINVQIKTEPQPQTQPLDNNPAPVSQMSENNNLPPVKQSGNGKTAAIITTLTILFLIVGFGSGFLGYRYLPQIAKLFSTSADSTPTTTSATVKPESEAAIVGDIATWPVYTNTKYKYSIKYPDTWYSVNTDDEAAETVKFSSTNPDDASISSNTIDIVFQNINGKTLNDWITASSTTTGNNTISLKEKTISGKTALQDIRTTTPKSIKTYLPVLDQVMIISYLGVEAQFESNQKIYDQMIGSIILN